MLDLRPVGPGDGRPGRGVRGGHGHRGGVQDPQAPPAEIPLPVHRADPDDAGPAKLVPGGRYSIDFAVQVAEGKYLDHPPFERQTRAMERACFSVDGQTLWDQIQALERAGPQYAAGPLLGARAKEISRNRGSHPELSEHTVTEIGMLFEIEREVPRLRR